MSPSPVESVALEKEFLVVCLCAAWCGTCRDYQAGFADLATRYPDIGVVWADIEDEKSGVEDWDIEDFPTVLIQRGDQVLFFGPMLPHHAILRQTVEVFLAQSRAESECYANGTPERVGWQAKYNYRKLGRN